MPPEANTQTVQHAAAFMPVLRGRQKHLQRLGSIAWALASLAFWVWWLRPEHYTSPVPFALVTIALAWLTIMPAHFLLITAGGRRPVADAVVPTGWRVAMVVTKAPSEPFAIVAETLEAMLAQDYPHDTWLADEDPTEDTLAWAEARGVRVVTRRNRADYHRVDWPRRTKCKEGNLAFFYDHYGYQMYDIVVQMDADHAPAPGYLRAMLAPFADPRVGYVSAPSICDRNAQASWSARGRLYAEATLHGSLQAGHNNGWAPLCIGSHYAVRCSALRHIGGLGPELAEDHSTTLMMNAAGWRGAHALDAIAHGLGPDTFPDLITQEYQWARSLTTILLQHTPQMLRKLPMRLRFQFLYAQLWYPLFSGFIALGVLMPIAALLFDFNYANISYIEFLLYSAPLTAILIVIVLGMRSADALRPRSAPVFTWESALFVIVRWPWALLGCAAAVYDHVTGKKVTFRVTPKGETAAGDLPLRVLSPYIGISILSGAAALLIAGRDQANGFYYFAILNAVLYAAVTIIVAVQHRIENGVKWFASLRQWLLPVAAASLFALPTAALSAHGLHALEAVTWNAPLFRLTEATFSVAGAGSKTDRILRFRFQWLGQQEP
jgi:cellulose synthase/poly-beta-1,6-N-acetylglucosamine synthase-like glycosyltransferase